MKVFVAGATGATGKRLVVQLLERGHQVIAVARSRAGLPEEIRNHANISVTEASLLDLSDDDLKDLVAGCDAVTSCLGHNLTIKGIFGPPRRLVTDAVHRLSLAVKANQPKAPVKFVLMNTTANRNSDLDEPRSFGEKLVVGLLRLVLPPQVDNEQAAEYLRSQIGQSDPVIEWVAVRPDGLIDEETVTDYTVHPSPIRSPIFDARQTSRINVGHFMAELITDHETWEEWRGRMPVIYNQQED